MVLLTPNSLKKKPGVPEYPAPPQVSNSAAPTPQPPTFAPPPPATGNNYGVSGPPSSGPTAAPQKAPAVENPYAPGKMRPIGTPIEPIGTPIGAPGFTTNAAQGGPPQPTSAPQVGNAAGNRPPGISERAWKSYNEINSTISPEQWQEWDKHYDPSCPEKYPYRGTKLIDGKPNNQCAESPDNCPEGYAAFGRDECRPVGNAGGPGSGAPSYPAGPGGGAGGPGSGFYQASQGGAGGIEELLSRIIRGDLENRTSRYSPEAVAALLSQSKATAEDQSIQQRDAINEDAAARGVLGAGSTGTALANARATANRQVANDQSAIAREKITADFQDRQQAIQNAQRDLDMARDWAYKQQMTQMQREQFNANLALAYARMQQEWDQLQARFGYGLLDGGI